MDFIKSINDILLGIVSVIIVPALGTIIVRKSDLLGTKIKYEKKYHNRDYLSFYISIMASVILTVFFTNGSELLY